MASIGDTLRISCLVFMIVAGATIFGRFLAITRLPFEAADWISTLALPNWVLLWIDSPLLHHRRVRHGCSGLSADLAADLFPSVTAMGYDPVWFGQVVCIVTTMGAIMPPIGICCYVVAGMAKDIPLGTVFRGGLYYIPAYIISMAILMLFALLDGSGSFGPGEMRGRAYEGAVRE